MKDTIQNENGQFRGATGRGVLAYRYKVLISALRLKQKTGMEPTRGVRILKVCQHETGLKTRNYDLLVEALQGLMEREIVASTITTDGVIQQLGTKEPEGVQ